MLKRSNLNFLILLCGLGLALTACNYTIGSPTPTPTATTAPSLTPTTTATVTPIPSSTPAPTMTFTPTVPPAPTLTPVPSETPTPSATPGPAIGLANDQWTTVEIPENVRAGLGHPYFSIVSTNERTGGISSPDTPVPSKETETLYLVDPASGELIDLLDLPASTQDHIFWSPDGKKLVYFMEPAILSDNTRAGGVYLLNLSLGFSVRLFNVTSLNPRGLPDHSPVWSPDGSQFAIALPTAYDVDIFTISSDGSAFKNVTSNGSYDLWPAWSPDGRRLAFVSDRNQCPTWMPGEPGSCSKIDAEPPKGGQLFVLDVVTGQVQQVSDKWVDSPPVWVSNLQIAFTSGLSDPLSASSEIWLINIQAGTARQVSDSDSSLNLGAAWAAGGAQVIYQRASEPASVVLKDMNGNLIGSTDKYLFSRYGFAAAWSPGGDRLAFAGRNGQCPYGLVVTTNTLDIIFTATAPRACDPSYSPDGKWLAYAGIQTVSGAADGRLDLYISDRNGYGARSVTSRLKGDVRLLGWVGPSS